MILEIDDVTKSFPVNYSVWTWLRAKGRVEPRVVLRGISLTCAPGEILGLLGANGAGKTTLIKTIATLIEPDGGSIRIRGVDVVGDPLTARSAIGYVPASDRSFYYRMTARENLTLFGTMAGVSKRALARRIEEAAQITGLADDLDTLYATYSTGMGQRLAIARALLHDPALLLLDEPTRAVDPIGARRIRKLVREELAPAGKAVVYSTNVLDEAWAVCDRVACLREGRLAALDTPHHLRERARKSTRYRIVCDRLDDELLARVRRAGGVRSVEAASPAAALDVTFEGNDESLNAVLQAVSCDGVRVRRIEPLDPPPDEVFATLVGAQA